MPGEGPDNDHIHNEQGIQSSHGARTEEERADDERGGTPGTKADDGHQLQPGLDGAALRRTPPEQRSRQDHAEEPREVQANDRETDPGSTEALIGEIAAHLPEDKRESLAELIYTLQTVSAGWSGWLPAPEDFNRFDAATRERMMRWNDAGTIDESARQDRLVDAEIEQARRGPRRALGVVLTCLVLAAVAGFWKDNTVLAGLFVSPPLLMFAQTLLSTLRSSSRSTSHSNSNSAGE